MADPIVVKVSELTELTDLAAGDLITAVDISEAVSSNKTKKLQAGNLKVFATAQLADSIVTVAKLANDAVETAKIKNLNVTTAKLAAKAVTAAKIADNTITATQLANDAVTEAKLGAIKRTIAIPVFGFEDNIIVKNFTNLFSFPPMLNGHVITAVYGALLGAVSNSGALTIKVRNGLNEMSSITISQSAWSGTGSINTSYDDVASFGKLSVNVTGAGSGAKGLTIYLEVTG